MSPRPRLSRALIGASVTGLVISFGAAPATPAPAAIEAKRAQLAQIQAQLDALNTQVEMAAEAYNGARYKLGVVTSRIRDNTRLARQNEGALQESRRVLAVRLRRIYATPQPELVTVLLTSGSITAAADQLVLLNQVGRQDARVVGGLREHRAALARLRAQLEEDRSSAERAVTAREREKARVEELLAQRQAVLDNASAELKRMLRAEEKRKAREAAAAAAEARRQAAAARAVSAPASSPASAPAPAAAATPNAPASPSAPPVDGSGANAAAARYALQFLGVPYVWGGASPSGFDCSGLATYVFAKYGKSVPHYTGAIWSAFPHVSSTSDLQVGDLVFFHGLGHMGIYLGGDQFVHAPHTGDVVKVSQFSTYSGYVGAVRP